MDVAQKAGDNSTQINVGGNIIVNQGLPQILDLIGDSYKISFRAALDQYSKDAHDEVARRLSLLEKKMTSRFSKMEASMQKLRDPSFQFMLDAVVRSAAQTDKESDYDKLVALMTYRMNHPEDRKKSLGVIKAIEVVHEIDDNALLFLTAHEVIEKIIIVGSPTSQLRGVLERYARLYEKMPITSVCNIDKIIDHLVLLDTIRIRPTSQFKDFKSVMKERISGFNCLGLKKGSKSHVDALKLLSRNQFQGKLLIDNELCEGYVRLGVTSKGRYDKFMPLTSSQMEALREVESAYIRDAEQELAVDKKIDEILSAFPIFTKAAEFWDGQSICFSVTSVGEALANVNARLYNDKTPEWYA